MNAQEIERLMDPGRIPFVPRTKLRPLRLGNDILVRTRLLDRLDCTQTLALIIAPAGYGKTTLVSTWLAQRGHPYAWLSLEDDDNAPAALLAGLVAAVRSLFPTFGADLFTLLHDPAGELTPALLLPPLLNVLDRLERELRLGARRLPSSRQPRHSPTHLGPAHLSATPAAACAHSTPRPTDSTPPAQPGHRHIHSYPRDVFHGSRNPRVLEPVRGTPTGCACRHHPERASGRMGRTLAADGHAPQPTTRYPFA